MTTADAIRLRQDLECVHYRPTGGSSWCGAMNRALDRNDETWGKIRMHTDITRVTCPDCLHLMREALKSEED